MDREAWWAAVHRVTESDKHTRIRKEPDVKQERKETIFTSMANSLYTVSPTSPISQPKIGCLLHTAGHYIG